MSLILNKSALPSDSVGIEFAGLNYGNTSVSFIIVEAQPGIGPKLHSHPYEEIFIIQEGRATFTVGDETLEAHAGQIIVAPAQVPHKFINSGTGILRQVDIHPSPNFITYWLED